MTGVRRLLAVDGGQTECRAAVYEDGTAVAHATGRAFRHHRGSELAELLEGPLEAIASLGDAVARVDGAALGLTGLPSDHAMQREVAGAIRQRTGARRVVVAGDAVTSHAGALGLAPGVVVTVGTGVMALGAWPASGAVSSGGRGYLIGDAGSGFAIGQEGLRSALRHVDGCGGSEVLWGRLLARFGSVRELHRQVYGERFAVPLIASFAEEVVVAATGGDEDASAILTGAAQQIAVTTCGAARLLPRGERFDLSWTGRLIRGSGVLAEALRERVRRIRPEARFVPPRGDGLDGAKLLAGASELDMYQGTIGVYEQ